jgi:hypothetical protein
MSIVVEGGDFNIFLDEASLHEIDPPAQSAMQ